jgi:hypothetical protein
MDEDRLRKQLLTLRIIWAALLLGQVMYFGVALFVGKTMPEPDESMARILWYVTLAALFTLIPLAYIVRLLVYLRGRKGGAVTPEAYATGNILFWAMCEGLAMLAITAWMINRNQGRYVYVAMLAFAFQVVNYPTGKLMRPEDDSIQPLHKR